MMMQILNTFFEGLNENDLPPGAVGFLNATYHPFLDRWKNRPLLLQQFFKPYAETLEARSFKTAPELMKATSYSMIIIDMPRNIIEAKALIAQGLNMLQPQGVIICAGGNKAGGTRLKKILKDFGATEIDESSKNRARLGRGIKNDLDQDTINAALDAGAMRPIVDGEFHSMPGIFGWDKVDKGSDILEQIIPIDLKGVGADFGCGYGFLAAHILDDCPDVKHLYCIDADWRAVQACAKNIQHGAAEFLWEDLTKPIPALKNLDFIVMNPPFHEGKSTDANIGAAFIKTAAQSLKPGGALWMVANLKLPYEDVLKTNFASISKKFEGQGFKVFCAIR